jgi:hypothetical protein
MKKLYILTCLIFILSVLVAFSIQNKPIQTAKKAHTEQLETYQYIITKIDSKGYYGQSLKDNTGIFLVNANLKGITLKVNDYIKVSFPKNDYEQITKVEKLNLIKQQYTIKELHNDYVTVHSTQDKTEYINFYYSDKVTKETLQLNDTIEAAFQKDQKGYNIIDWYKIN